MKVLYRILQFLMIDHAFALVFILVTGMEGTSDEMTMILLALAPSFLFFGGGNGCHTQRHAPLPVHRMQDRFQARPQGALFALHMFGKRRLHCPCCGRKKWCKGII